MKEGPKCGHVDTQRYSECTAPKAGGFEKCNQICHFPGWD